MSDATATDLLFRPVTELAGLVSAGEVSASELVQASLDRIEALDDTLNAFIDVDAEGALETAGSISPDDERPFAGVPIAIKNNRPVSGWRLTQCCDPMGDFKASHDAYLVRRLRDTGFVIVGTTALPEYGILPSTESRRFGPTLNPWDTERTTGGSSGGSAAAVAGGMVPIAHGNDGGGSTRIPAACCGLVGLKPQRGRISMGPDVGDNYLGIDGVLTRTVADTAALLDVMAGYEPGDATWAPPPPEPFAATAGREPGRLRIALATDSPLPEIEIDPASTQAVRDTAALLESLGHDVEEANPPWVVPGALDTFLGVFGPLVSLAIGFSGIIAGRELTEDDMEPLSWELWSRCRELDSITAQFALIQMQALSRGIIGFFGDYDVLLTPVLAQRPVPIGTVNGADANAMDRASEFTPFTAIFNATGQPAISLPLFHGDDGLPLAVQLVGRPAEEGTLLALSAQLEAAHPWADRRPDVA